MATLLRSTERLSEQHGAGTLTSLILHRLQLMFYQLFVFTHSLGPISSFVFFIGPLFDLEGHQCSTSGSGPNIGTDFYCLCRQPVIMLTCLEYC